MISPNLPYQIEDDAASTYLGINMHLTLIFVWNNFPLQSETHAQYLNKGMPNQCSL